MGNHPILGVVQKNFGGAKKNSRALSYEKVVYFCAFFCFSGHSNGPKGTTKEWSDFIFQIGCSNLKMLLEQTFVEFTGLG